jgi:E3 ubiquitin-protein ligase RNF144
MALTSTSDSLLLIDDFYFSALCDEEEVFPISDEKYAQELQLQEALMSSAISSTMKSESRVEEETGESSQSFCAICMDGKPTREMVINNSCAHSFCSDCTGKYVAISIQENISTVTCPDPKCRGLLEPQFCRSIIPPEVYDRWNDALCESLILAAEKFYCPFKDCSAMLVDDGGEVVTRAECPDCRRLFCAQCKVSWHAGIECREFQELSKDEREREDIMVMDLAKTKKWKRCPRCKFYVEKIDGCLHISCRLICTSYFLVFD